MGECGKDQGELRKKEERANILKVPYFHYRLKYDIVFELQSWLRGGGSFRGFLVFLSIIALAPKAKESQYTWHQLLNFIIMYLGNRKMTPE